MRVILMMVGQLKLLFRFLGLNGLREVWRAWFMGVGMAIPPHVGDEWRINFSRVQWTHGVVEGRYERVPKVNPNWDEHPEGMSLSLMHADNWVWSSQHEIYMHEPKYWGRIRFQ
jgi:hypothetical protein